MARKKDEGVDAPEAKDRMVCFRIEPSKFGFLESFAEGQKVSPSAVARMIITGWIDGSLGASSKAGAEWREFDTAAQKIRLSQDLGLLEPTSLMAHVLQVRADQEDLANQMSKLLSRIEDIGTDIYVHNNGTRKQIGDLIEHLSEALTDEVQTNENNQSLLDALTGQPGLRNPQDHVIRNPLNDPRSAGAGDGDGKPRVERRSGIDPLRQSPESAPADKKEN